MKNFLTMLFALLLLASFNAFAATTTTNKVQSPSGNLTLDTPSSASSVVIPSNILASDPSKTHSLSGTQINNATISSTGTDNLTLKGGSTGDKLVEVQGTLNPQRMVNYTIATDATTTGSNTTVTAYTAPYVRFTNASLVSIDMIPAPNGTGASEVTFFNNTPAAITFNHDIGATAANRIFLDAGSSRSVPVGRGVSFVYNYTSLRWVTKGGSGGVSVSGETGTTLSAAKITVPNAQATETASGEVLLETGNNNILANPSFENATYNSGWTSLTGTAAVETSVVIHGKKSYKSTYSSAIVSLAAFSTLYGAQFADDTVQGLASVKVKAPFAVKICAYKTGATTNICSKPSLGSNKWEYLSIPFVLGATSNGFELKSDAAVTGVMYVDDAFVGPQRVVAETSVVGPWTTFTPTGSWTTNTTYTGKYRQVGQNLEVQVRVATSGLPTATTLQVNLPTGFTIDTSNTLTTTFDQTLGYGTINDSGTVAYDVVVDYGSTTSVYPYVKDSASTYVKSAFGIGSGVPLTFGSGDFVTFSYSVPVTQFAASTNTLSSTNGNTSWAPCGHTTSDFTGFGTVTNIETQCKRDGDDLWMRGKFTSGTHTSVEARIALKHQGNSLTSAGISKIPSLQESGVMDTDSSSTTYFGGRTLMEPSVGYITTSIQSSTSNSLSKTIGTGWTSAKTFAISARIPIANWENSNVIVASLKDTPTTIGSTGSDFQSVTFGSGANCATACTTGTCTICRQTGAKISSVQWLSTGVYRVFGIDGIKYTCYGGGFASTYTPILQSIANSTSTYVQLDSSGNSSSATVNCWGIP